MEDVDSVVRKQNRILRKIVKILRKDLKNSREYADNLFIELCETEIQFSVTKKE